MRRWLLIFLAIILSGWFPPTAFSMYALRVRPRNNVFEAVEKVELSVGIKGSKSAIPNVYVYDAENQLVQSEPLYEAQKVVCTSMYDDAWGLGISQATANFTYDTLGIHVCHFGGVKASCRHEGITGARIGGMYCLRARYYRPDLGRFWTMDTFEGDNEDPASLHKYLYAANNPVNLIDPSGHDFSIISFTATAAINGAVAGMTFGTISGAYAYAKGVTAKAAFAQAFKVAALTEFAFISPLAAVAFTGGGVATLGLGIYSGDVTADDIPEMATYVIAAAVLHTAMSPSVTAAKAGSVSTRAASLEGANYAQTTYRAAFSSQGKKFLAFVAGKPINTVDDLVAAIRDGSVAVRDLPVDYIVRNGKPLILNTRTAQALEKAGIPRSQWNAVDQTGSSLFEGLLDQQLRISELNNSGTPTTTQR